MGNVVGASGGLPHLPSAGGIAEGNAPVRTCGNAVGQVVGGIGEGNNMSHGSAIK